MKKLNCVLLIDDDPITTFLNTRLLQKLDISKEILTASNGVHGLAKIFDTCLLNDKSCPEIIFVDLNMPGMDGFEFIKEFNNLKFKNKSNCKLAVLTTSNNLDDLEKIFNLGVKSYVHKPLTEESVLSLLEKFE